MKKKLKVNPQLFYNDGGEKSAILLKIKDFEKLIDKLEDLNDKLSVYERTLGKKIESSPANKVWKKLLGE